MGYEFKSRMALLFYIVGEIMTYQNNIWPVKELDFPNCEPLQDPSSFSSASQTFISGWVCPKCGAVMSPNTAYCINCMPVKWITYEITC